VIALILAGGLGTRLRHVVSDRPKPMALAGGKPFLEYQIEFLRAQGWTDIVLCLGHQAGQISQHFRDGRKWGVRIRYAVETELLGTAGALRNAAPFIDGPFLVLNGDSYLQADLPALLAFHRGQRAADPQTIGALAAVHVEDASAYGTLELDEGQRIRSFREKASAAAGWVNGGIYVLEPEILSHIPPGRPVSLEKETFPLLLERGYRLYAHPVSAFFVDIGTPAGYARFQRHVQEGS